MYIYKNIYIIMQTFLAALKRSRTRRAPTPTYISSNSEPEAYLNGTPASPWECVCASE